MSKPADGLEFWSLDEVAECLSGIPIALSSKLWGILNDVPKGKRVPAGGDGSNGTIEFPPEPDAYPDTKVTSHWDKFTPEEQHLINTAYEKETGAFKF
jgi:hypothetical protein